jgi:hypothetical protein
MDLLRPESISAQPSRLRLASALLVAGCATFWAGAFTPPYGWWFGVPVAEYLRLVHDNRAVWLWIAASFAIGVLLTLAGLSVLRTVLRAAGDPIWSELGHVAFFFGSVLWLASIAFRATATVSAAEASQLTGAVPAWFEPMHRWAGLMFAIYMVLAYAAVALYGRALLSTTIAPPWFARAHIVFGTLGAAGFVAGLGPLQPPLVIHLLPALLGISLLRRQTDIAAARRSST